MTEPTSRRETIKLRKRTYRKLDDTPIEIPAGRKSIPDTKQMVKAYVHQALEQAGAIGGYDTVEQMLEEELDLEPDDPEPLWASQYEVQEMVEEEPPREPAPPVQEGEASQPNSSLSEEGQRPDDPA